MKIDFFEKEKFSFRALVEFAPQHSTRQMVNSAEFPLDQVVTSATSHTNILPAVYFAVKARYEKINYLIETKFVFFYFLEQPITK